MSTATHTQARSWVPDAALPGFEATTLAFADDYDGPATATLVRRPASAPAGRAVLYIHGFIDYFFQAHLADAYNANGFSFYALDLRKHGRSLLPGQHANFCKDLREYFAEIDAAIDLSRAEAGGTRLLLNGHSTGGLTAALYAQEGARREAIDAIFLNSPFLDMNVDAATRAATPLITAVGRMAPFLKVGAISPLYAQSVHRDHRGEWAFDLRWKPIAGFPAYAGWTRAIIEGQRRAQAGLRIPQPILLMHSARSGGGKVWNDSFTSSDCVLNVEHMRRFGPGLGDHVTLIGIEGGLHDLCLSAAPAREQMFSELFAWVDTTM
jgi:alpha-beta hydrolase superfamily lysophospholipase